MVEAGRGGTLSCAEHPLGEFCLGLTGAVTRVRDDGPDETVLSGLPSIAVPDEQIGPSDIAFTGNSTFVLTIGLGGTPEFRAELGDDAALLGTLVTGRLDRGDISLFSDVLANEAAANPDGTDIDSNPVGLLRHGSKYLVADAGGNAVVESSRRAVFDTVAVLPPGSALAPPFLGLPPGTQIPTDAVPTSVVRGRDGAFYISQLTGFPFEHGDANIWRSSRAVPRRCTPRASRTSRISPSPETARCTRSRSPATGCCPDPSARSSRSRPGEAITKPSLVACSPRTAWRSTVTSPTCRPARSALAKARSSRCRSTDRTGG